MPADLFARSAASSWASTRRRPRPKNATLGQRARRAGWHKTHGDGSVEIHARFGATGEQVLAARRRRTDRMWHEDGGRNGSPDDGRTHAQRRADALAELICKEPVDGPVHPKHQVHIVWNLDEPSATWLDGTPLLDPSSCN